MNSVDNTNLPSETVYPPCTRCGYLSLYQADNDPGYEPPNDIHLLFVRLNFKAISWQNVARSANACSLFRYLRLESLISLEKWRKNFASVAFLIIFQVRVKLPEASNSVEGGPCLVFRKGGPCIRILCFNQKSWVDTVFLCSLICTIPQISTHPPGNNFKQASPSNDPNAPLLSWRVGIQGKPVSTATLFKTF